MAAVLNAASNAINQIYDLEIDRINKPQRPLPSGRLTMREAWIFTLVDVRRRARARLAGRARRPARVLLDRARGDGDHRALLGAALPHQAAGHLGQRDDRDPARRPAESRRLVGGEDSDGRRALVHRRDLRPVPARRVDDEGLRRHGRRRPRRLPHAADHLRRSSRGVDDLAVVRRPVPDDRRRRVDRHPDRQLRPAARCSRRV